MNLTNFTDDPERIGRNSNRRKNRNMADAGNEDIQHQQPEEHEDNEAGTITQQHLQKCTCLI